MRLAIAAASLILGTSLVGQTPTRYEDPQGRFSLIPPAGWTKYPGGHLLSYDLKTGKFEDFGLAPDGEGVITFNMDTQRGRMFGVMNQGLGGNRILHDLRGPACFHHTVHIRGQQ